MKRLIDIQWYKTNAMLVVTIISIIALKFAFVSQYFFDLAPCELCIYQRIPYAFVIFIGFLCFLSRSPFFLKWGIGLSSMAFFINSGIAFFHVGVEQKWWEGLSTCGANLKESASLQDLKNAILSAPVTRCDEVAWDFLGISMAGYNVLICLLLGAYLFYALWHSKKEKI